MLDGDILTKLLLDFVHLAHVPPYADAHRWGNAEPFRPRVIKSGRRSPEGPVCSLLFFLLSQYDDHYDDDHDEKYESEYDADHDQDDL